MSKFQPYVLHPIMGSFKRPVLVCALSFAGAVRVVCDRLWFPVQGNAITDYTINPHNLPGGAYPTYKAEEKTSWTSLAKELKSIALEYSASPEAVLLLHSVHPFTPKEFDIMAKAATKVGKKADKPAAPAKEAAPKAARKGNPDALKKAREAKAAAGPDTRKITVKDKANPYREGSNRAASFDALKGAKTVQDYVDAGGKAKYISRWVEENRIEVK